MPTTVEECAPAKVNLTLHVTGRRPDGYHLLDSLVVFADCGERLTAQLDDGPARLRIDGPSAGGVPTDGRNLVLKAAALFDPVPPVSFRLHKTLPSAAGIGGGSSDAAAALRAICRLTGQSLPPASRVSALGADIPVCLDHHPQRMEGVGEILAPLEDLPPAALLLVNPGISLPTGAVFQAMDRRDNPPMSQSLPAWRTLAEFADWLSAQRNDLEPAACAIAPQITRVLGALSAQPGCHLARMSGSGATCFGLFARLTEAEAAAAALRRQTEWWLAAAPVLA